MSFYQEIMSNGELMQDNVKILYKRILKLSKYSKSTANMPQAVLSIYSKIEWNRLWRHFDLINSNPNMMK